MKTTLKTPIFIRSITAAVAVSSLAFGTAGCASHTEDIAPQYVSPMEYQDYSCRQISQELAAVSRKASEVGAVVDDQASTDSVQMGVGLILLWPTLFFLDGDTPQAAEYAHLKGQFDALEKASRQKGCEIGFSESKTTGVKTVVKKK